MLIHGVEREQGIFGMFAELSLRSLREVKGQVLRFTETEELNHAEAEWDIEPSEPEIAKTTWEEDTGQQTPEGGNFLVRLAPRSDGSTVVAVDASCRSLGEVKGGLLCALRGALVWRSPQTSSYHYLRYGPYLLYAPHAGSSTGSAAGLMIKTQAQLERALQLLACSLARGAIILFDGSLSSAAADHPIDSMAKIIGQAQANGNVVIAISKKTALHKRAENAIRRLVSCGSPCLMDLGRVATAMPPTFRLLGRIFLAKLSPTGRVFRVDMGQNVTDTEAVAAVERLIGNELFDTGYPETLRLAHILSVFTSTEALALQRYLTKNYGLTILRRENLRRILFGPYGKWNDT